MELGVDMAALRSNSLQQKQILSVEQKLTQRIMMSPRMQQALRFLQLPIMELSRLIDQEMEINPLLELIEEDEDPLMMPISYRTRDRSEELFRDSLLQYTPTLRDLLYAQLKELCEDDKEREIGLFIIDNFDESGFLSLSVEEISLLCGRDVSIVRKVLEKVQTMDPPGIGAKGIQESLLIQLKRKQMGDSLAYRIVKDYYDDLLHNRILKLKNNLHATVEAIESAIKTDLAVLEIHPGLNYAGDSSPGIIPDVVVHEEDGVFRVEVLDEFSHRLHLNNRYMKMFSDPNISPETKNFLKEKVQSAKWLMKNIAQRNSTLQLIVEELIKVNRGYFSYPEGKLAPLTMKKLADVLELHESTINRAVAGKYLSCDRGVIPLKTFFTSSYRTARGEHISSATIRDSVRRLIGEEDPKSPLSDAQLSQLLKKQGIQCARRTIAKYRGLLKIGSTSQRRQYI